MRSETRIRENKSYGPLYLLTFNFLIFAFTGRIELKKASGWVNFDPPSVLVNNRYDLLDKWYPDFLARRSVSSFHLQEVSITTSVVDIHYYTDFLTAFLCNDAF